MGTSGSYGGSGGARWNRARQLLDGLPTNDAEGSSSGDGGPSDTEPAQEDPFAAVGQAIGDALAGDDPDLNGPVPTGSTFPISSLLPRPSSRGGGGGGAGGGAGSRSAVRGVTGAAGRLGGRSRRRIVRGAARGGAAIGGAYALRRGDGDSLAEIGLALDELQGMSPRMQCARILDAVLGDAGHPDEFALRQAAVDQIKAIILADTPPDEADAIRGFIASYVFQLCIVELRSKLTSGQLDSAAAARKEVGIRAWIERRVRGIKIPAKLAIAAFRAAAAGAAQEAIRILRAGS